MDRSDWGISLALSSGFSTSELVLPNVSDLMGPDNCRLEEARGQRPGRALWPTIEMLENISPVSVKVAFYFYSLRSLST